MAMDLMVLQNTVTGMKQKVYQLERETTELRLDFDKVMEWLAQEAANRPVASYVVDGQKIILTEADVAHVRAKLIRPHSEEAIKILALSDKIAARRKELPPEERHRLFCENVEAMRAQALLDGTAIKDEWEAAIDD